MRDRIRGASMLRCSRSPWRRVLSRVHSELVEDRPDPGEISTADPEGLRSDSQGRCRSGWVRAVTRLPAELRTAVEELANALQAAAVLAAAVRRSTESATADAVALEQSIGRAVA